MCVILMQIFHLLLTEKPLLPSLITPSYLQADENGEVVLPDGSSLRDSAGRPILAAPEQEVLVDVESMKAVLDSRGQPVITKPGNTLAYM